MQLFNCRADFEKYNNNCWPFFDVQRFKRTNKLTVHYSFLRAKDIQQLINGRRIVGIVIKICALLQIFLPILENGELLTHVIATKSMTQMRDMSMAIYYSEQNRPDKSLCVNSYLKANLNLVNYYDIKTFCVI